MRTEIFSLPLATSTQVFDTLVRVIRYDEGSGTGTPKIRIKSLSGGAFDVEMVPGRQIKLPDIVRGLHISNMTGSAITGKITIGAGDISDNSLVGTVTLDAATLAALESVDLNAASLSAINQPLSVSGSFATLAALTASAPIQIIAPGTNVNGALILSAGASDFGSAGPPSIALISKSTPPTNSADGVVYGHSTSTGPNSGSHHSGFNLPGPQHVPAGHGLYFICDATTNGGNYTLKHCRYKLL